MKLLLDSKSLLYNLEFFGYQKYVKKIQKLISNFCVKTNFDSKKITKLNRNVSGLNFCCKFFLQRRKRFFEDRLLCNILTD